MHSNDALKTKVANLEKQVNESEPGVGEIMGVIQMHHTKLYYAGTNANWTLAKYELSEIQENLNEVMDLYPKKFKQVRVPLPELIPSMTKASMDQVQEAIQQKNEKSFVKAYKDLSTSCSNCHAAANNPFINIQVPAKGMYTDQQFKP
ncbi:MAG TPA: hypothetical protein VNJ52_06630 [Patescibacteria group bacterium]|nr:hypothetical protein [Patescibacteria group bacterium]